MNLPPDSLSPGFLLALLLVVAVRILVWFALDMRSILKSLQRRNQLATDGRWEDLDRHFQRTLKSWRPFAWLQQRYLLPGSVNGTYALFLYERGRYEEALEKLDAAIRQIERKPRIFRAIYRSRTFQTLCSLLRARTDP